MNSALVGWSLSGAFSRAESSLKSRAESWSVDVVSSWIEVHRAGLGPSSPGKGTRSSAKSLSFGSLLGWLLEAGIERRKSIVESSNVESCIIEFLKIEFLNVEMVVTSKVLRSNVITSKRS